MPDVSGASTVNTRVHTKTTKRTRGCGCIGHPAFPAPSDLQMAQSFRKTRTHRAARSLWCVLSLPRPALTGRGRGEGLSPRSVLAERAPHPPGFACASQGDLSPQERGEVTS